MQICIKDKEEFIVLDGVAKNQDEKKIIECIEYNMKEEEEIYLVPLD